MKRLQMKFKCENGKAYNMSLQNPKAGLDAASVKDAFSNILQKNLIVNKDGSKVMTMDGAKIVTTTTETLF